MIHNDKYKVLSLFSGCGGLDLGFRGGFDFLGKRYFENNFEIVWANDINKDACLTYQKYFKHPIVCCDIREIIAGERCDLFNPPIPQDIEIVLGGFPCQDFSHAGKREGFDSKRGNLYQAMAEIIRTTKPAIFLAENVKGLLTLDKGSAIKKIVDDFEKLNYHVSYKLLLSADFGVPQKRERVIIIGSRKDILPAFNFKIMDFFKTNWTNLGTAIGDLENLNEGAVANHYWSKAKRNNGQGNNVVNKNSPAPTMRAEHHGNIEFHWNGARRLSAREAARIQSFPDELIFWPSTSSAYKQIGNAVPPVFAWYLANAISVFLKGNFNKKNSIQSDREFEFSL